MTFELSLWRRHQRPDLVESNCGVGQTSDCFLLTARIQSSWRAAARSVSAPRSAHVYRQTNLFISLPQQEQRLGREPAHVVIFPPGERVSSGFVSVRSEK